MQTILIEINNQKVFNLLQELEDLKVLKILKEAIPKEKTKLSDKYRGAFSKEDAQSFDNHTQKLRKEWDSI